MLGELSIRQFNEWRAYADLEPFDEQRADLRAASVVQALLNIFGRRKGQAAIPLEDCVLLFDGPEPAAKTKPEQGPGQVIMAMDLLMHMFDGQRES